MKCDKNECIACNEGYKLLNGKCFSYSFKGVYKTTSINESVDLINDQYYSKSIVNLIIDGNETKPSTEYIFPKPGNHKVFFYFDIEKYKGSLYRLFSNIIKLVEISFNQNFNTQNITDMGYMFSGCHSLVSADLSNLNTENVNYFYNNIFLKKFLNS